MKYRLKTEGRLGHPPGTAVERYDSYDYGLARDDTLYTGREHLSVWVDREFPIFTHPLDELEEIS